MELFMMNCELLAACSALGYLEDDKYYKEPDCIDTLKCLIHYLQQEDNSCTVRIQLNAAHIVVNDLIPILVQFSDEDDIFSAVLRLLVNMTKPVTLCLSHGNSVPSDVNMHYQFMSLLSANQDQKDAFCGVKIWSVLAQKAYTILEKPLEERSREDSKCIEAILVLIRNLLYTPCTSEDETKTRDDISAHDKLIIAMHIAGFDNLIAYIAGSQKEKNWCLHVLEIISLMVKEHEAERIAKTGVKSTSGERKQLGNELMYLRAKEGKGKSAMKLDSRHSRFGSTFVAKGISALSEGNNLILHKSVQKSTKYHFDDGKSKLTIAKNRRPLVDSTMKRHSTLEVRKVIKEFCKEFLETSYNTLMKNASTLILAEKSDEHDESYFFWVMNFFMEFNRHNDCKVELVSETLQLPMLHFINVNIVNYYEMMATSKEYKTWGRRVHLALRCYMELLQTLQVMNASSDPGITSNAQVIMNTLFYVVEYREIFLLLLRKFDERKQTRGFLRDVVKATHLFIKLFSGYCGDSDIVVEKTVSVKRKSKIKNVSKLSTWEEVEENVLESFAQFDRKDNNNSLPQLAADSENDLHGFVYNKLQQALVEKKFDEALELLHQAQDNHQSLEFFSTDGTVEGNMSLLKSIYLDHPDFKQQIEARTKPKKAKKEVRYTFEDYIKKFADVKIATSYLVLFSEFEYNSAQINHYVVVMLNRVAVELKMYGLFFSASAFRSMQKILSMPSNTNIELKKFSLWLLKKFFKELPQNNKLLVEILLPKNSLVEVMQLTDGYTPYETKKKVLVKWTEEEKDELKTLFEKHKETEDIVGSIIVDISDESRTRKQICNQLVDLELVSDLSLLKAKTGKQKVWRRSNIAELTRLFEEFKNSTDPVGNIKSHLTSSRSSSSIIEKLMSLDLVQNRRDLYKKRTSTKSKETAVVHIGGNESSEEEEPESNLTTTDLIKELTELGYSGLTDWLRENLEQALNDRKTFDKEALQPIPLVAFTKDQETGLNSSSFKCLLSNLKIQKPSDQEMFWRIPVTLTEKEVQDSISLLTIHQKRKRSESDGNNSDTVPKKLLKE